ncbi:hypothetical protein F5Y02DRAFT_419108 [Annulohypoxylon stygium]|nr:hypothetical protein F5Y02DRAFT_419108 [Annulohypoxylon stygium]
MLSGPLLVLVVGVLNTVSAVQNWPITAPVANEVVLVARPYTIRWNNDTKGPVSITLNYNQQPVILTSSTVNNGTFVWTPASCYLPREIPRIIILVIVLANTNTNDFINVLNHLFVPKNNTINYHHIVDNKFFAHTYDIDNP